MMKRAITIVATIVIAMLIVPIITVHTVKSDAGMMVTLLLFFVVHPIVSAVVGILAGKDVKHFWFSPLLVAGLFWLFSCFKYEPAIPVLNSAAYFAVSAVSMFLTWLITQRSK